MTAQVSPLATIEAAVHERARTQLERVDGDEGDKLLRRLISDEIATWQDLHRRGLRPHALADPELVAERAFRNVARYGPLTTLLEDDDVWEVMVNAPDSIFVRRHRGQSGYHDEVFLDDDHVIRTLTRLL